VVPLVRALTGAVHGPAAGVVHLGATSQDVLDTAAMLVARRATAPVLDDLDAAGDVLAGLADTHRRTPIVGRTLLQQAAPTTFGAKAAGWLAGLDQAAERLAQVRGDRLAVQLGGAVGTLAALGDRGPAVLGFLAEELALAEPAVPWHTERTRIADLAGALASVAGAAGKPARDIVLLAQTEVDEVREAGEGRGGSSTLPNKRNPIAAIAAVACAERAPGLATTLLSSMLQEHERAAGAWHAEWLALADLLSTTGAAVAWLLDSLEHLTVDEERMRANLALGGGLPSAEAVATALAGAIGRLPAHDLVARAAAAAADSGGPFEDHLWAELAVQANLTRERLAELLDPSASLGSAEAFVDRALAAHEARRGEAGSR
jgi:3-carboxy-cis,cis-muconate cycloisomerase